MIDVDVLEISRISRLQKNVPEKQVRKPAATDGTYLNIGDSRFGGFIGGPNLQPSDVVISSSSSPGDGYEL